MKILQRRYFPMRIVDSLGPDRYEEFGGSLDTKAAAERSEVWGQLFDLMTAVDGRLNGHNLDLASLLDDDSGLEITTTQTPSQPARIGIDDDYLAAFLAAIPGDLLPDVDASRAIGSPSKRWYSLYLSDLLVQDGESTFNGETTFGNDAYFSVELEFASTTDLLWSATTDPTATKDVGLIRAAANRLQVTDGSSGKGDLFVNNLDVDGIGTFDALNMDGNIDLASSTNIRWSNTSDPTATKGVGIERIDASTLGIYDGITPGTLHNLQLSALNSDSIDNSGAIFTEDLDVGGIATLDDIDVDGMPTTDPESAGRIWNDGAYLRLSGSPAHPMNDVNGFEMEMTSVAIVSVSSGIARDVSDDVYMSMAASTCDISSGGTAIGGLVHKVSAATATTNGTTTITASASVLTEMQRRTLTGTYSTSGTAATGSGTKWRKEISVGDLLGDNTNGYSRVTAVASDTGATLVAALPGGNATAGTTCLAIENATVWAGAVVANKRQVSTVTANGLTIIVGSATTNEGAGLALKFGVQFAGLFYYLHEVYGSGQTVGLIFSSQRTTPWLPSSYTHWRLLTMVRVSTTDTLYWQAWSGSHNRRTVTYEELHTVTRVLSSASATTWTAVVLSSWVPPLAVGLNETLNAHLYLLNFEPTTDSYLAIRPRGIGSTSTNRPQHTFSSQPSSGNSAHVVPLDGARVIDYVFATAPGTSSGFIDLIGYDYDI